MPPSSSDHWPLMGVQRSNQPGASGVHGSVWVPADLAQSGHILPTDDHHSKSKGMKHATFIQHYGIKQPVTDASLCVSASVGSGRSLMVV